MHIIQILRSYLGITQQELAQKAGISQPDLCEMEIKTPYGRIDKYQRLSDYLGISVRALVTNDCRLVSSSFFERHPPRTYTEKGGTANMELGRSGEDAVFDLERHRPAQINTSLASLVLPFYKLRHRPGYDILSFDESGVPIFIEVKTTTDDNPDFALTKQEYLTACKLTKAGEKYSTSPIYGLTGNPPIRKKGGDCYPKCCVKTGLPDRCSETTTAGVCGFECGRIPRIAS